MAGADHLIGSLVLTTTAIACAEVARPVRYLNALLGAALLAATFVLDTTFASEIANTLCGLALIGLAPPRGPIRRSYGEWDRWIV
jgi:hypothetical protein